eukprot:TRINITY_DN21589_c0_g1_i1.p1 TRINITY_DN21589_c0_g1~~TRINITY_DN21589_c0_g1_i1.p1  ORF type:complete len:258 (+),score=57.14 TRINITY_DN21589_c0_g1_i1:182-955(+)
MLPLVDAFVSSLIMIIMTEIGDKTFFIAAILCMRHNKSVIFSGALLALAVMTVLSAYLGHIAMHIISPFLTNCIGAALFVIFGIRILKEANDQSPDDHGEEEYTEAEQEIRRKQKGFVDRDESPHPTDVEAGVGGSMSPTGGAVCRNANLLASALFLQTFTMTFAAEWGDRSQIATITLGAQKDTLMVTLGGIVGHALCTGVACVGGSYIRNMVSMRTVHFVSGAIFVLFGVAAALQLVTGYDPSHGEGSMPAAVTA